MASAQPGTPVRLNPSPPFRRPPSSQHSPRVGEVWRTGQTAVYGGWFRPSPKPQQQAKE